MDSLQFLLKDVRQDITENHLQLKAITQDISACTGPVSELHSLNSAGRSKIAALRKLIDKFSDVILEREQLASSMDAFKKANLKAMLAIEKGSKDELLKYSKEDELRRRNNKSKENMVQMSTNVTDQLLNISKQLADTTKQVFEFLFSSNYVL
ncbi:unnamed protein product [Ceutorhynchus assimilis]|uniref:Uncharacterized protein n=1 Tax=Ceutorhynchus assimilis TaxID=467358 RepID=A0A9N9QSR6_9CUCU|nr:unnamed protein product [Ceutorhynchus assimilis]